MFWERCVCVWVRRDVLVYQVQCPCKMARPSTATSSGDGARRRLPESPAIVVISPRGVAPAALWSEPDAETATRLCELAEGQVVAASRWPVEEADEWLRVTDGFVKVDDVEPHDSHIDKHPFDDDRPPERASNSQLPRRSAVFGTEDESFVDVKAEVEVLRARVAALKWRRSTRRWLAVAAAAAVAGRGAAGGARGAAAEGPVALAAVEAALASATLGAASTGAEAPREPPAAAAAWRAAPRGANRQASFPFRTFCCEHAELRAWEARFDELSGRGYELPAAPRVSSAPALAECRRVGQCDETGWLAGQRALSPKSREVFARRVDELGAGLFGLPPAVVQECLDRVGLDERVRARIEHDLRTAQIVVACRCLRESPIRPNWAKRLLGFEVGAVAAEWAPVVRLLCRRLIFRAGSVCAVATVRAAVGFFFWDGGLPVPIRAGLLGGPETAVARYFMDVVLPWVLWYRRDADEDYEPRVDKARGVVEHLECVFWLRPGFVFPLGAGDRSRAGAFDFRRRVWMDFFHQVNGSHELRRSRDRRKGIRLSLENLVLKRESRAYQLPPVAHCTEVENLVADEVTRFGLRELHDMMDEGILNEARIADLKTAVLAEARVARTGWPDLVAEGVISQRQSEALVAQCTRG